MEESPNTTTKEQEFRERAVAEATRYGSDSWVFVRELLQNARDADARSVVFTVEDDGATERLSCRDDGHGMSYADARRYLFALYASSKEDDPTEAGQFGVGFWSVLRFAPSTITVCSRTAGAPGWRVRVDGALEHLRLDDEAEVDAGTEVVLERPAGGGGRLADDVFAAAWHHGRFLRRRGAPADLAITVNGRSVNAELGLPPPCATFEGKGFRGVVALGDEPKVELFAHGLFVRSAASLRDLRELAEYRDDTAEDALAQLPSMAPQVLLDSSRLDLLLARSDARQSPHLKRMLRAAETQLRRLVTRQLQTLRPQPWYRLWLGALRDRVGPAAPRTVATALALGLVLGAAVLWWRPPADRDRDEARRPAPETAFEEPDEPQRGGGPADPPARPVVSRPLAEGQAATAAARSSGGPSVRPYSELSRRYRGPLFEQTSPVGESSVVALAYEPAGATPLFNALVIDDVRAASWSPAPLADAPPRYRGSRCAADCVDVRLIVAPEGAATRIPVPSGHRLDASSVRLDGAPSAVFESPNGEAVLLLAGARRGLLEYRTGPAAAPRLGRADAPAPEAFHDELAAVAAEIRLLSLQDRVRGAVAYVAGRVTYRHAAETTRLDSRRLGADFVSAALAAGEGDCDVQNAVLVSLLRAADVEARLAVGYVGLAGTVAAGAHAWVEYGDGHGSWYTADASVTGLPHFTASAPSAAPATEPLVAAAPAAGLPAAAPPDTMATAPPTRSAAASAPSKLGSRIAVAAVLLLAAGGSAALVNRRRHAAASLDVDEGGDLASLLGGALRHPTAFAGLTALHHGRFVPLVVGAPISLARARRLANQRHLFRSDAGSDLAGRAARRRVPVVDAGTAEGRVLSLALGAVDLDHWSQLLERGTESEVTRRVDRILEDLGEPWRLRETSGLDQPVVEIALDDLQLGRRQVLVDLTHREFLAVDAARPATAAFAVLDVVLERVGLTERSRARVLSTAAGRALREEHGP